MGEAVRYKYIGLLFPLLVMPFFLTSNGVYQGTTYETEAFALPLSLFLVGFAVFFNFRQILTCIARDPFPFIYLLTLGIIFLITSIRSNDINPALLLVSNLPLIIAYYFGFLISTKTNRSPAMLERFIRNLIYVTCLIAICHIISSFLSYGVVQSFVVRGEDSIFGLFSIYQKLVYYPTIISSVFVLNLYSSVRFRFIVGVILFIDVLIISSRESLVICFLGFCSLVAYYLLTKNVVRTFFIFLGVLMVIGTSIYFFVSLNTEANRDIMIFRKINNLSESDDYSAGRGGAIEEVFSNSNKDINYFMGTGYSISLGDRRTPHNQFLEIFLRSGLLGFTLFIVLLIKAIIKSGSIIKARYKNGFFKSYYSLIVVLLIFIFIAFNINTPIRAPYSAVFFGVILGLICAYTNNNLINVE